MRLSVNGTLVDLHSITGGRNLLILATTPGDESQYCGHLIAQASAKGRPPFVAILTDGNEVPVSGIDHATADDIALRHAQDAAKASSILGVPDEWFLVLGLHDGTVPTSGARFDAVVEALSMIMWRRDCDVIATPWNADRRADYAAAYAVGAALCARDNIAHVTYRTAAGKDDREPLRLAPGKASRLRLQAISTHAHLSTDFLEGYYRNF
jgi:LmbE family N-acetylglucosaminyl deacetylase